MKKNLVEVVKVATEDNIADTPDTLTKSLGRIKFEKFRETLNTY